MMSAFSVFMNLSTEDFYDPTYERFLSVSYTPTAPIERYMSLSSIVSFTSRSRLRAPLRGNRQS